MNYRDVSGCMLVTSLFFSRFELSLQFLLQGLQLPKHHAFFELKSSIFLVEEFHLAGHVPDLFDRRFLNIHELFL